MFYGEIPSAQSVGWGGVIVMEQESMAECEGEDDILPLYGVIGRNSFCTCHLAQRSCSLHPIKAHGTMRDVTAPSLYMYIIFTEIIQQIHIVSL